MKRLLPLIALLLLCGCEKPRHWVIVGYDIGGISRGRPPVMMYQSRNFETKADADVVCEVLNKNAKPWQEYSVGWVPRE